MVKISQLLLILFLIMQQSFGQVISKNKNSTIAIAVHGGASNIRKLNLTKEQEAAYIAAMDSAIKIGYLLLQNGSTSVDAVTAVVVYLENNPLFNAGRGSVIAADSTVKMDAAIMDGSNLNCGAATGLRRTKNPILVAQSIMLDSKYIFLNGEGAESYAKEKGLEFVDPSYFITDYRWNQFLKVRNTDTTSLDNDSRGSISPIDETKFEKFGTVGAVALDQYGNLAAATSTGGLLNKKYERIGDSPIIGAGTYADNQTCAVSCTGKGEDFIRLVLAHEIASRMRYKHESLNKAVDHVIQTDLKNINGRGGCIAVDRKGNVSVSYTTSGMFHAFINGKGESEVRIFP